MSRSCRDCPSFVPENQTIAMFGVQINADVCYSFGHVLSRPTANSEVNSRTAAAFAHECLGYMNPRPATPPSHIAAQVAIGDPEIAVRMSTISVSPTDQPVTCLACQHFVPPADVVSELGWSVAMCAAKGRLLFPQRYVREAAECGTGIVGGQRLSTDGVILLPSYEVAVTIRGAGITTNASGQVEVTSTRIDPRDYPTDVPVTDHERNAGHIRAWRFIPDPEGIHEPVKMPVYFGEELVGFEPRSTYGLHRPDLYIDHQGLLYDVLREWFDNDATPALIGGGGSGKTELFFYAAYMMDLPARRVSVAKSTEGWQFYGENKLVIDPATNLNITEFRMGRFSEAMTQVGVLVVDEPNLNSEIFEDMRPVLDSARQLVVDGQVISMNELCLLGLAQNPAWDPIYIGCETLSAADLDRISPIFVDLPNEEQERTIIATHCADGGYAIPVVTLDKLMQVAKDLRELINDGTLPIAWGLRAQIKVAKKTKFYSFAKAYRRALVDALEPAQVEAIMAVVDSVSS